MIYSDKGPLDITCVVQSVSTYVGIWWVCILTTKCVTGLLKIYDELFWFTGLQVYMLFQIYYLLLTIQVYGFTGLQVTTNTRLSLLVYRFTGLQVTSNSRLSYLVYRFTGLQVTSNSILWVLVYRIASNLTFKIICSILVYRFTGLQVYR